MLRHQATAIANQAEKRQRAFDKTVDEWKRKVADLQAELDNAHSECRNSQAQTYTLKSQIEEYSDSIDALRRENKNLSGTGLVHSLACVSRGRCMSCQRNHSYVFVSHSCTWLSFQDAD